MRYGAFVLVVLLSLAGCATGAGFGPDGAPAWAPEAHCERNGGVWRPALNYCEPQFASLSP